MSETKSITLSEIKSLTLSSEDERTFMRFAKIQMALAGAAKEQAQNLMNSIQENQTAQSVCQDHLSEIRKFLTDFKDEDKKVPTDAFKEAWEYMLEKGLQLPDMPLKDDKPVDWKTYEFNKEEINLMIEVLSSELEKLGSDTQTIMVNVNDFMTQYNNYLQAASSTINDRNSVMQTIFS